MNLNDLIKYFELKKIAEKDLLPANKNVTDAVIRELKGKQELLNRLSETIPLGSTTFKRCYRYGMWMVEQCEVCESCLKAEDLQWNEGDE